MHTIFRSPLSIVALNTRTTPVMCRTLKALQQLARSGDFIGQALVPYYRQLLPIFNIFKNKNRELFFLTHVFCTHHWKIHKRALFRRFPMHTDYNFLCFIKQVLFTHILALLQRARDLQTKGAFVEDLLQQDQNPSFRMENGKA